MAQLNGLMRNYGVIQNSMDMLSKPIALQDRSDAKALQVSQCRIVFENVCFDYGGQGAVIRDISLTVQPGPEGRCRWPVGGW